MRNAKLLLELLEHPGFVSYIKELKEQRPHISKWKEGATANDWIFESGYQAGFDFVLSHFEGEP